MSAGTRNTQIRRLRFPDAYLRRLSPMRDAAETRVSRSTPTYDEPSSRTERRPKYDARVMKREKPRRGPSEENSPIVPRRRVCKSVNAPGVRACRLRRPRQGYQFGALTRERCVVETGGYRCPAR